MTTMTDYFENPLTLDKWIYYNSGNFRLKFNRTTLTERFQELEQYPQIIDNFFSINWRVRDHFTNTKVPVPTLIAFMNLFYHHSLLYPEYSNWHEVNATMIDSSFPHFHQKFSAEFIAMVQNFKMGIWDPTTNLSSTSKDPVTAVAYAESICLMLATVYGEERVIEVMDHFSQGALPRTKSGILDPFAYINRPEIKYKDLHTFVAIVGQWKELKDFPVDWTVTLTDSPLCHRLSDPIMQSNQSP